MPIDRSATFRRNAQVPTPSGLQPEWSQTTAELHRTSPSICVCAEEPPAEFIKAGEQRRKQIPLGGDFQPDPGAPVFVAVGHGGRILLSRNDGKTWKQVFWGRAGSGHGPWATKAVAYTDGVFVVPIGWRAPTAWLASEDGPAVISSDTMPRHGKFKDFREFRNLLKKQEGLLLKNIAHRLATFALGRSMTFADNDELHQVAARTRAQSGGLKTMIRELVTTELFRKS